VPLFVFDHVGVDGTHAPRLDDVTGSIPSGGVTVIVGPSGAGKSTLLRLCNRLEVADRGVVSFHADDVVHLDPISLRRRVGMVFQRPTPFRGTVGDNLRVAEPTLTHEGAVAALERVELDAAVVERDANELSGGEAQRMCLARTLVTNPEVVLMDEPTSSVDPAARGALELLGRSLASSGVPVVWVTHDLAQMHRIADHVVVVIAGRIAHASDENDLVESSDLPQPVRDFLAGTRLA
jgi:putative ABC transport system ATP-binding protein